MPFRLDALSWKFNQLVILLRAFECRCIIVSLFFLVFIVFGCNQRWFWGFFCFVFITIYNNQSEALCDKFTFNSLRLHTSLIHSVVNIKVYCVLPVSYEYESILAISFIWWILGTCTWTHYKDSEKRTKRTGIPNLKQNRNDRTNVIVIQI